jgi:phage terminase small subunit
MRTIEELFVEQYVIDFDPKAAAMRCGIPMLAAGKRGHSLLQKIEVAQAIQKRIDSMTPSQMVSPTRIAAKLLEVSNSPYAKYNEQVAAIKELRAVLEAAEASGANTNRNGVGGVMLVPLVEGGLEGWAKIAKETQRKLKESVRD